MSDSNIIAHAQNAATNYNNAKNKENELLSGYLSEIETYLPGGSKNSTWILTEGDVTNTYGEDWTYAYVYNGTTWEGPKTKANGDTAEGQIVAKFYKQTNQVDPETIYYQSLALDPTSDYAYKLAIEGTGSMGSFGNLVVNPPQGYAWQEGYMNALMGMPYELLLTPYITEVTICGNTTGITDIGNYAFMGAVSLQNVVVANTVEAIGEQAFYGCAKLENVSMSRKITTIEMESFYGCSNLKNILIPDSVKIIKFRAFKDCTGVEEVTILSNEIAIYGGTFTECTNLQKVKIYATKLNSDPNNGLESMPEGSVVYVLDPALISEVSDVGSSTIFKATVKVVTKEQMDAL